MCLGTTGVVTQIYDDDGVAMALVDAGTVGVIPACLLTCAEAAVGDTVLVHAGYVLRVVEAEEDSSAEPAARTETRPAPAGFR
ncbi:MAG TPA: HypC/HybG/HupF family hydrogenase formation chaperone [Streptosporangiaceae bacterium]|nr:HypC/HybG/HupF family hydrogenase formation chaperone [Streptosporangiaceae bacterium]